MDKVIVQWLQRWWVLASVPLTSPIVCLFRAFPSAWSIYANKYTNMRNLVTQKWDCNCSRVHKSERKTLFKYASTFTELSCQGWQINCQSAINGKYFIHSINMYIKNYICSRFESLIVIKLCRLDSLNSNLQVIRINCTRLTELD